MSRTRARPWRWRLRPSTTSGAPTPSLPRSRRRSANCGLPPPSCRCRLICFAVIPFSRISLTQDHRLHTGLRIGAGDHAFCDGGPAGRRSRPPPVSRVPALASGYLFSAAIVIPHALTFPGAFSETGLLGANDQTTAWLYVFWHAGFPIFALCYALFPEDRQADHLLRKHSALAIVPAPPVSSESSSP